MPALTNLAGSTSPGPVTARILVTVGTDHHPFDRLITWVNEWLAEHPEHIHGFFVQAGAATVASVCAGSRFLAAGQLDALLDSADAVVCHGGPGSIADAWQRGTVPIVVPRLRRFGEVVDDHQLDFSRKLAGMRRVVLAEEPTALARLLEIAVSDRSRFRISGPAPDISAVVRRFGDLVAELAGQPRRRVLTGWRHRLASHLPLPATAAGAGVHAGLAAPPGNEQTGALLGRQRPPGIAEVAGEEQR
jgi:UDP-N-acetylglucosamine transferase subunit ALG13